VEASLRYHEISYAVEVDEGERLQMLSVFMTPFLANDSLLLVFCIFRSAAITCAILAPAGPQRSRLLATLYRDERAAGLPHNSILAKVFLDHIVRPAEIESFAADLKPHQLASLPQSAVIVEDEDVDTAMEEPGGAPRGKKGPENVLDRASTSSL
jgi:COP9 signalosome complex subunit 4